MKLCGLASFIRRTSMTDRRLYKKENSGIILFEIKAFATLQFESSNDMQLDVFDMSIFRM